MKASKPINTVNIIQTQEGDIIRLTAFRNTPAGQKAAREHFRKMIVENTDLFAEPITESWLDDWIKNGYKEDEYKILWVHSDQQTA